MSMTYAQLTANIQDICENTFTSDQLALFVQQTEQFIYNAVQIPSLRKNVTGTATSGTQYLSVPTDFLYVYSLAVIDSSSNYHYLLNKDVNFIRESFPSPTATGTPTHYAVFDDDTYILGPTPDLSYAMELHYFYYPQSIVTAGTSWLGDNFDSVLLYGALIEAHIFMKGEADVYQSYTARYNEAMTLLKQLSEGKNRQDMYRTQQARYEVK